jgi:predicted dinucleotide-binding enzyme
MGRFGVLGSGEVGQTLAGGLKTLGHDVRIGSRSPSKLAAFSSSSGIAAGTFQEVAAWAESLVLSVAGHGAEEALRLAGAAHLAGKLVIETTNPLGSEALIAARAIEPLAQLWCIPGFLRNDWAHAFKVLRK